MNNNLRYIYIKKKHETKKNEIKKKNVGFSSQLRVFFSLKDLLLFLRKKGKKSFFFTFCFSHQPFFVLVTFKSNVMRKNIFNIVEHLWRLW